MRKIVKRIFLLLYDIFEFLGVHIISVDYFSPIPESKDLTNQLFERKSDCIGVDWNIDTQENYLNKIFPAHVTEVEFMKNGGLSLVDAAILHAMIRYHKPRKIVEIGGGVSTQFAARACVMNQLEGRKGDLVSIEPYPSNVLRAGFEGLSKLITKKVEDVDIKEFADCDLLFIDSSHVLKMGGDVNYEILEIIPRLKAGALIHWHDVLLPGEYWKSWVKNKHYFFTEQYMIHAFLKFNEEFEIIWASRYMHLRNAQVIKFIFPYFEPENHHITSLWIRRKVHQEKVADKQNI